MIALRASGGHASLPTRVAKSFDEFGRSRKSFWAVPCDERGRLMGRPFRAVVRPDLGENVVSTACKNIQNISL